MFHEIHIWSNLKDGQKQKPPENADHKHKESFCFINFKLYQKSICFVKHFLLLNIHIFNSWNTFYEQVDQIKPTLEAWTTA